jgi:hypothetical protein
MWEFPAYGSHLAPLCRCFAELADSKGAVLEMGCGDFSTPLLHELCAYRKLVSLDINKGWTDKFQYLANPQHIIRSVESWDNLLEYQELWDIVLVDQSPGESRKTSIEALADKAKLIVLHDTEDLNNIYGYQFCIPNFKYLAEYKRHTTQTMIISNFIDISGWWK